MVLELLFLAQFLVDSLVKWHWSLSVAAEQRNGPISPSSAEHILPIITHKQIISMKAKKPSKFEILTLLDYQQLASQLLPPEFYTYFISGSDEQITLKNNMLAFKSIHLVPRVLVDMTHFSMATRVMGYNVDLPFGVAPFAMQKLLHHKGELLPAAEAFRRNTVFALSSLSTTTTTDIFVANPSKLKILQVYFMKNAEHTKALVRLAERQDFTGVVVTVDSQAIGKRREGERNNFAPAAQLKIFGQIGLPFKIKDMQNTENSFMHQVKNDAAWSDIRWLRQQTKLKIILKGVMSWKDVAQAEKCGVDALWVSNHGGRKLDCTPATVLAVPMIRRKVKELKSKMEIYVDGGVKSGCDIFKCLALGADFVFIGRGFMFSLVKGEEGISEAFDILSEELKRAMLVCGSSSIREINGEFLTRYPRMKL